MRWCMKREIEGMSKAEKEVQAFDIWKSERKIVQIDRSLVVDFAAGCVEIPLDKFLSVQFFTRPAGLPCSVRELPLISLSLWSVLHRFDFSGFCRLLLATRHTKLKYMRTTMFYSSDGNDINFGISANAYCTHTQATAPWREERCVSVHVDCGFVHVCIIYPIF